MRATKIRSALLAVAVAVAASVALKVTATAMHRDAAAKAYAVGQQLAGSAYFEHGKLQFPAAIAAETARLNHALDACYTSHGATSVSIQGGGSTYQDPHGVAQAACQPQQDAVNAFADGPEMVGFSKAVEPLIHAFWACMVSHGVVPPNADDVHVDTQSPAFTSGADACSTAANHASGIAAP